MMDSITEIVSGIYQLQVPIPNNPLGFTLPYLIKGSEGTILIDTGVPAPPAREALDEQLKALVEPGDLLILAITHAHPDHSGLAGMVKELAPQVKVAIHKDDWSDMKEFQDRVRGGNVTGWRDQMIKHALDNGFPEEEVEEAAQRMMIPRRAEDSDQVHRPVSFIEEPDILMEGGENLSNGSFALEAIHTPGHSPGHLCFYEKEKKIMFTGDHVLPVITSNVSIRPGSLDSPLESYVASLDKIANKKVDIVCPAHEEVFYDLKGRITALHQHHDKRLDAVADAVGDTSKNGYEIAESVPWDVGAWAEMDAGLRRAALGETLAHLEVLVRQGRVQELGDMNPIRFALI
ncbi:MAG: MBL fold metallo-hydrolase [SAR202 cluster bacterium]|nr:MBL fold metallo-hydrolase [SAR202 cluster bacterium]|tara:strand:- start:9952 stop:10992 length:1041 start_codon:yes stop_codon:yes gene_type:complete